MIDVAVKTLGEKVAGYFRSPVYWECISDVKMKNHISKPLPTYQSNLGAAISSNFLQLFLWDLKAFPGLKGHIIPPV